MRGTISTPQVIPAVQNGALQERLAAGAICADVGCSGAAVQRKMKKSQQLPTLKGLGVRVQDLGFFCVDSGFRVLCFGVRISGFVSRVQDLGFCV